MERFLREYDKECMKMMMLKHEETFRQQVQELHRLYRVQKLLMRDMKSKQKFHHCNESRIGERKNATESCRHREQRGRRRVLNLGLPADEYIEKAEEDVVVEVEQESDTELKLTIGSHRRKTGEASLTCDSGGSFSSSSNESGGQKLVANGWELQHIENGNVSYDSSVENRLELQVLREERRNLPNWHLQCLSLRLT